MKIYGYTTRKDGLEKLRVTRQKEDGDTACWLANKLALMSAVGVRERIKKANIAIENMKLWRGIITYLNK